MAKVFVSSGHSATDPGAVSHVVERDEVWEIANLVAKELGKMGIAAYRDNWTDSWRDTVNKANSENVDLFVEFHENAGGGNGAEVIIHNSGNQRLADVFKEAFLSIGQEWRRTIIDPTFWVLKYTCMPAIIVEVAFVDNYNDIKDFITTEQKQNLAKAMANAISRYFGQEPKEMLSQTKIEVPKTDNSSQITVDGKWGYATSLKTQTKLNLPYRDGIISNQNRNNREDCLWEAYDSGWEWVDGVSPYGSETAKAIQRFVGAEADGVIGPATIKAMQKFLGVTADGIMGKDTVSAWQRYINS